MSTQTLEDVRRTDKVISILGATRDGDDLAPRDLYLMQLAANDQASEAGLARLDEIWRQVLPGGGGYKQPWFYGEQHLTKDHQGYVHWRGREVEHYSFPPARREDEAAAAAALATQCRRLEELGLVPGGTYAPERIIAMASDPRTAGWVSTLAKVSIYTIGEKWLGSPADKDTQAAILFWVAHEGERYLAGAVADSKDKREDVAYPDGEGLDTYYGFQSRGFDSVDDSRGVFLEPQRWLDWTERYGFTPGGLEAIAARAAEYVAEHFSEHFSQASRPSGEHGG